MDCPLTPVLIVWLYSYYLAMCIVNLQVMTVSILPEQNVLLVKVQTVAILYVDNLAFLDTGQNLKVKTVTKQAVIFCILIRCWS